MRERAAADSEDRRVALQERLDRATQQRAESVAAMSAAQPSMVCSVTSEILDLDDGWQHVT